ncbi:MAG: hypothetical protein JO016_17040 [Actinobacteria bacterium]|nr:hypothetical protein [Actinomycetota bacterium]
MNKPTIRPSGTLRQRCARWLGLDRNLLRRPADRAEAYLRLLMAALVLIAVPLISIASGLVANHVLAHQAQVQRRSDHLVSAVLTQQAPVSTVDPFGPDPDVWVQARWTAPDGAARSGQILASSGTQSGQTIPLWVNQQGLTVDSPAGPDNVLAGDILISVSAGLLLVILLMALQGAAKRALDRQRLAAWDAEWRATGPLWTDHRG